MERLSGSTVLTLAAMSWVNCPATASFALERTSFCTSTVSENPTDTATVVISGRNANDTTSPWATSSAQADMQAYCMLHSPLLQVWTAGTAATTIEPALARIAPEG